jgi:phosphatidyl-myo-inositol dimannoside synthase
MRMGIVAPEFPPLAGGMQEHARRLVECLASDHELQVFTSSAQARDAVPANVAVTTAMQWRDAPDQRLLANAAVDAWLLLNAGISPYISRLRQPAFVYVHGNDFVYPWYPLATLPIRLIRRIIPNSQRDAMLTRWRRRQVRHGLRAARMVIANSDFTRDLCINQYGLSPERTATVAPGIGEDFFQVVDPLPETPLRIVTISRLSAIARRKNIDGVLEAIALLRGEMDIVYTIVGDGDDRERLEARAAELGVTGQVAFVGRLTTEALRQVLASNHLFVMAVYQSERDVEGFGMAYAEAAASGLPSLGTMVGGIPEAVQDGVTGLLLQDSSPASIAEGLRNFQRVRDTFDPAAIRAFARGVTAPRCSEMIAGLIARAIRPPGSEGFAPHGSPGLAVS